MLFQSKNLGGAFPGCTRSNLCSWVFHMSISCLELCTRLEKEFHSKEIYLKVFLCTSICCPKPWKKSWLFISFQNPLYMSINNANTAKIAFKLHFASWIHPLHQWFCHSLSPDFLLSTWTPSESPIVMMQLCGDYYALNQTGQPSSSAQIPSQAG